MRFFGRRWDANMTDGQPFEDPPAGAACAYECGQPITAADSGVILPHTTADGRGEWSVLHRDCFFSDVGILPGKTCGPDCNRHPLADAVQAGLAARYLD